MSISAIISIIVGFGSMFVGYAIAGGVFSALIDISSITIVFGGTIGAVALSFPPSILKKLPGVLKVTFTKPKHKDLGELIKYFKEISIKTRKDGLLSIEETIASDPNIDPFIKKGLQLVVDGVEPQTVRNVLEAEAYMVSERHKAGVAIFETAGGYAPTMGIIGTVMHLVEVMGSLSSNPDELGPKIGAAFLATLYGIWSANLLYLPVGSRLKMLNKAEDQQNELIIEAIISIQEGLNPNTLVEKLKSYLDKDQAKAFGEGGDE